MIEQKWTNLNEQQEKEFQKIKNSFPLTLSLIQRTKTYYIQFRNNSSHMSNDQILLAMKCSFFMAEKSETMQNMKGQKIRGIGLSLNNLIKSHKLEEVMFMLKQISKKITIKDQDASNQIKNIVEQISSLIKFSDKFQKIMKKLQIRARKENQDYQNYFSSLAWLLFVQSKHKIVPYSQQIVQNTCLLAHVISFMIIYGWNFIRAEYFYKGDEKLNQNSSQKQVSLTVKNKIFQIFKINNLQFYEAVATEFEIFINEKFQKNIIKHSSNKHFLSPQMIEYNYKKLDQAYSKNIDPNCLDHRIFFKERNAIMTPSRFTPFMKQGYLNKGVGKGKFGQLCNNSEKPKMNYLSHRIIDYQNYDRIQISENRSPTFAELKFPKNIIQSPSTTNIPLIQTPLAAGMEMYNYLNHKSKLFNDKNYVLTNNDTMIFSFIDKFFSRQKKAKSIQDIKKKLVFSLFKAYLKQFIQIYPKETGAEIEKAMLGLIMEMVCFVNNIHVEFNQIQAQLQLSTYHEWKVCDFLLKSDRAMPMALKGHILDLEVSFVTQRFWYQEDIVQDICQFFRQENVNSPLKRKIQRVCARIIFQMAFQINQISSFLKLNDDFSQKVFQLLKSLLDQHINLFQYRSVDQIILCSFYFIAKITKSECSLGQIKQAYVQMNPQNTKDHQNIVIVNTPQLPDNPSLNLVQFYNKFYLQYAKEFLKCQGNQNQIQINNSTSNKTQMLLKSPLKSIIPNQTNILNKDNEMNQLNKKKNAHLFAYSESPLLKNNFHMLNQAPKGSTGSRKALDFEKQQAKILQKTNSARQIHEIIPDQNHNIDQFLNRRFKQPSFTQKNNIENISPRSIPNFQSRANSVIQTKGGILKPSNSNNLGGHLNMK